MQALDFTGQAARLTTYGFNNAEDRDHLAPLRLALQQVPAAKIPRLHRTCRNLKKWQQPILKNS